jgi:arginine decarboxylase
MEQIYVTAGRGEGLTELSAFDRALFEAGIANFNLIELSSVIPPHCEIIEKQVALNSEGRGRRLYVVLSSMTTAMIGEEIWAGIGWVQALDHAYGLFVEHHAHSEKEIIELIKNSLISMQEYRPDKFGEIKYKIQGAKCVHKPVGALVAAIYKKVEW